MAAGTVAYQDTRGNKDYLGMIASQIGRRLKEASDMASDERDFAEKQAEAGGTSLKEAGIGKGYFFKRALGSRFGGDRIARTRGRLGATGAGTNPTGNFKTRFRGGFDYNVTNEIQSATVPLSSALVGGLRGVESGLQNISTALTTMGTGMGALARGQSELSKATYFNGQILRVMVTEIKRQQSRLAGRREERSIEGGGFRRGGGGGSGSGIGGGGGRRMINVTPQPKQIGGIADVANPLFNQASRLGGSAAKTGQKGLRTAARGITTAVANPSLKFAQNVYEGGRSVTKFLPNAAKIAQGASKMLGVPVKATKNVLAKTIRKAPKTMYGLTGAPNQTMSFLSAVQDMTDDGFFALDELAGAGDDAKKLVLESFDMLSDAKKAKIYATASGEELSQLLLKSGYSGNYYTPEAARSITKKFGPKAANTLTGKRIADLSDAGYKTAEIATDQLVRTGVQQGLKRGSGLARSMVKTFGAAGTRSILKKIPIIAGIAGTIFAVQRALEGDFLGAGLELTSGILGATGIGGIGPGLAIDGFLLARDFGVVPMAKGGLLTGKRPVNALMGEAGPEIVAPLNDDTFIKFGEGILEAQKQNKTDYANIQAAGLKKYYESMGGWKRFKGLFNFFRRDNNGGDSGNNGNGPNLLEVIGGFLGFGNNNNNTSTPTGNSLKGLSKEDYVQMAKTIAGEAGPGKDQYLVAAAILNRVASGKFPNSVAEVVQAGQDGNGQIQFEGYRPNANVDNIVKHLMSPEGQRGIVNALQKLEGRTDFKGQSQLHNMVPGEDIMLDPAGNFAHYWWQTHSKSKMPSDYVMPNYQQFINSTGTADLQSNLLNQGSSTMSGLSFMTPTIINNYYTSTDGGGGDNGDAFFGPAFNSDLSAFTLRYSLASK